MPRRDVRMYLIDARDACDAIREYSTGKDLAEFRSNRMLRSAIEREFSIIGEAIVQMLRVQPNLTDRISNAESIARFRNILIHAYDLINYDTMWRTTVEDVPILHAEVCEILDEIEGRESPQHRG
ncbi:MAG: HepT-like ribonuclease domain-containing protein [Phycisphaerales bacterium]